MTVRLEWLGDISPDGRRLAYESNQSGAQFEIDVRPFPERLDVRKCRSNGGRQVTSGVGNNELYFVDLAWAI
jgi:Tol biopolymer transport system component